jgi:cytochrome c
LALGRGAWQIEIMATIRQLHRAASLALALALGLAAATTAHSQGMMGSGMMGGGMMGGYGPRNAQPPESDASAPGWNDLSAYVRSERLPCMSCHALSARGTGPAYLAIAHRFSGKANGRAELAGAISNGVSGQWAGYPPMPGGFATSGQARRLAALILQLAP